MLSIFIFILIFLSSENNVKPSCTQLATQIYLPPYSTISTRWHISAVAWYIPSNWHSPSLKPKALPPGAWRTTQPQHYCQSKLCSVKQDSPLALWTWGVRVAGFESTGRALRGEMLSVGYRALPVACVLPAWHFLPLTPGCATAVTQDRAASREMRRLGLLHKRERSGRAGGLQMKNGNKRRASGIIQFFHLQASWQGGFVLQVNRYERTSTRWDQETQYLIKSLKVTVDILRVESGENWGKGWIDYSLNYNN